MPGNDVFSACSCAGLFTLTTANRAPYHLRARREYLANIVQVFGIDFPTHVGFDVDSVIPFSIEQCLMWRDGESVRRSTQ